MAAVEGGHVQKISPATSAAAFVEEASRWLPRAPDSSLLPSQNDPASIGASYKSQSSQPRARVLVADDSPDMRDYVRRILASRYDVDMVANGAEALEAVRRSRPDLLLSDVMMPVCDGFELLRQIRSDPSLNDLPVILLSARAGDEAKVEGLDAGADDYLIKPFSAQELLARVNTNITMLQLRREVTAELEIQKMRLQAVLDTVPVAVWFTYHNLAINVIGNRRAAEMLRMPETANVSLSRPPALVPQHFRVFKDGAELPLDQLPLRRAVAGETVVNEELELHFDDGTKTTGLVHAAPLKDFSGKVIGAVSAGLDITDRKRVEVHRVLLLNELNHRVKNTLATVQSIAAQSFRRTSDDASARDVFEARLLALARAHDVLTNENWEGANLDEIVDKAIAPYRGGHPSRFQIRGPHVRLSARMALSLSMVLHELATNAVKYGALASDKGRIDMSWQTNGQELYLEWLEADGPTVSPPRRKGFGSRLIEHGLAQELGGNATIEYRSTGVWCQITARLGAR
jgi:two-component sensor histidine kinase/CheY-like chemotaxis protein